VAVAGDDENYIADFPGACQNVGLKPLLLILKLPEKWNPIFRKKQLLRMKFRMQRWTHLC
jgi:hypothetical protein